MLNTQIKAILFIATISYSLVGIASQAHAAEAVVADEVVTFAEGEVALTTTEMDVNRGAAGVSNSIATSQTLSAATSGNSLNVGGDLTNGNVSIGENFGGFGSYVMNTGNNSTVNSAVNFNLQIMPSP